jgi:hypothetical protein
VGFSTKTVPLRAADASELINFPCTPCWWAGLAWSLRLLSQSNGTRGALSLAKVALPSAAFESVMSASGAFTRSKR